MGPLVPYYGVLHNKDFPMSNQHTALDEQDVKFALSTRLEAQGFDVYWEQKNAYGYKTFTSSTLSRPDILAVGEPTFMIEAKNGIHSSETYDALLQNQQYINQYLDGQEYQVDGETIDIDGFVVANRHSMNGFLFGDDSMEPVNSHSKGRRKAVSQGHLPNREGQMTEMFVRIQWRALKRRTDCEVASGALLSTTLDGEEDDRPALLWWRDNYQQWEAL